MTPKRCRFVSSALAEMWGINIQGDNLGAGPENDDVFAFHE